MEKGYNHDRTYIFVVEILMCHHNYIFMILLIFAYNKHIVSL